MASQEARWIHGRVATPDSGSRNRVEQPTLAEMGFVNARPVLASQRLCSLIIDAEEDFDWLLPIVGVSHSVQAMHRLGDLHRIVAAYGAVPAYLVTYPVLQDDTAVATLRLRLERGECVLGVQLHTWVTPPFEGSAGVRHSFATNLDPGLEERKLHELISLFQQRFGQNPLVFKAGRYGLGRGTPDLLERNGFVVDTSLAPRTSFASEHGPDFSTFDYQPFWFGTQRRLLELPLCRSIVGWGGRVSMHAQQLLSSPRFRRYRLHALLAWSRCAERITLSPEGNDFYAMRRLARRLVTDGRSVLVLSLHSSSLSVGHNPYVRSLSDLHLFYDRLSAIMDELTGRFGVRFVHPTELAAILGDA